MYSAYVEYHRLPDDLLVLTALSSIRCEGRYRTKSSEESTMLTLDAAMAIPASIGAKAK